MSGGAAARAAVALAALAALATAPARACPVCVAGAGLTPAQRVLNATSVLLVASPPAPGGPLRTIAVIKGAEREVPTGALPSPPAVAAGDALVLIREPVSPQIGNPWSVLGTLSPPERAWLRRIAAGKPSAERTDADWRALVAFHRPYLEHRNTLLASTAWGEIARAPYAAIHSLAPVLDAAQLGRWVDDPVRQERASLYLLLLGIAGGDAARDRIERRLAPAAQQRDDPTLGALLVADLELHGEDRLAWLERQYLLDRRRPVSELQAALLALSVQGGADLTIPRARIVELYRRFIRTGHPFAGFPADDLLRWKSWEAVPEYIALLDSRALQNPASTYLVLKYLDGAPQSEARAAAAAFRARTKRRDAS